MEENTNKAKTTHIKNLNKFNFNSTLSVPVDTNVNIKTILDVNTYLYDEKIECGNGKAIISGKIGIKALYIDTDNITNILTDNQSFTETLIDNAITSDCYLNISNATIVNNILSSDSSLKVNCDVNIMPVVYLNLSVNNSLTSSEYIITKKSEMKTISVSNTVNSNFEYTCNFETRDNISKILTCNSYFTPEKITTIDNGAIVEGKIYSNLVYETNQNEEIIVKNLQETFAVKSDVNLNGVKKESMLDLYANLDKSKEEILTELEDNNSIITIKHFIKITGVELTNISMEMIDDMFSTDNDLETIKSQRECTKASERYNISEIISNEITLSENETAIDDVIANLNMVPEITNSYIKDGYLILEGIVTSNLLFIDENKETKHKDIEIPFIINTKIAMDSLGCVHTNITIVDNRIKVKRGTIIEVEYTIHASIVIYEKQTYEMVDSYTLGKPLDFSKYDFQIFIAKQGESMWDLCKRIKISPNDIGKYNKDLPLVMQGGEKVIIKR